MKEYLLLIHDNAAEPIASADWEQFFYAAKESGHFEGGSVLEKRAVLGNQAPAASSDHIGGYMIFTAESEAALQPLLDLHPVIRRGGTVELFERVKS